LPKLIELESKKSPSKTILENLTPSGLIFCLVLQMYLSIPFVSPIFILAG
jgi:hypothetical protein